MWNSAVCIPIHNVNDNVRNIENYRSVSIVCNPSKIFEQIIYTKPNNFDQNILLMNTIDLCKAGDSIQTYLF